MSDQFNVTASYDKASYNAGDTMKITIAGNDVQTTTQTVPGGTLTITVAAADGATTTLTGAPTSIQQTIVTPQPVHIASVVDSSGRAWTVSADGQSATATA